jgi:endo-1,4-beta-xylanase
MDVHKEDGTAAQAKQYADVFRACVSEPACVSWTTWGVTDTYDLFLDDNNSVVRGEDLLWDAQSKPTPALAAMLKTRH